jgi:hypothetical protein
MRKASKIIPGAVAFMLTACADLPMSVDSYSASYVPGEELFAGNDVPVVVRGNAYAVPEGEFNQAVIDAMQGWAFRDDHFVPAINPNAVYRVIVVFNAPSTLSGQQICARPFNVTAQFGVPPMPRVPVSASLCRGDTNIADAFGSVGTAGGPGSEVFRRGIGQFTASLFPPNNPDLGGDGGCKTC